MPPPDPPRPLVRLRGAPKAVVAWLLALALACVVLARGFSVDDDLTLFLPGDASPLQQLLLGRLREGTAARTILVGLEGADAATRTAASRALADALRDLPDTARVENGVRRLDLAALGPLFERRYLLAEPGSFERDALRAALEEGLRELQGPFGAPDKELLAADPTARSRALIEGWLEGGGSPARADGVWVSPDGGRALLLVETAGGGLELHRQAALVAAIRARLRTIEQHYGVQALLSGPAVLAADAAAATRAEATRFSVLGSALVAALLLLAFRSLQVVLLGVLPLASGALAAVAVVHLAYGSIHGITLAFGITLLGVAIDYPLHLFSHARADQPLAATVARVWPPLRLGLITTVLGYGAMVSPDFGGLAQLGLFASTGLLGAGLCVRYVVPALCPEPVPAPRGWLRLGPATFPAWPWRVLRLGLLGAALPAAAFLVNRGEGLFETDLAGLSPVPEAARELDRELRAALGAPDLRHLLVLRADSLEAALQRAESLEPELQALQRAGAIGGFELVSRYLPSAATQRARQAALPAPEVLQRELAAAQAELPFRPDTFAPFLAAVERSRRLAPMLPADLAGTPLAPRVAGLLARDGAEWHVFVPLIGVADAAAVARLARADGTVAYADLKLLSAAIVQRLQERALARVVAGVGVILLVLAVAMRHRAPLLRVAGALLLALLLATAALVALGERLSLFHIVAGLLVVGIGVDYGVFFGWQATDLDRRRTLGAVLLCVLSTVAVFGVLATSSLVVLHAIGLTVTIGTLIAFVCSLALVWSPAVTGSRARPG